MRQKILALNQKTAKTRQLIIGIAIAVLVVTPITFAQTVILKPDPGGATPGTGTVIIGGPDQWYWDHDWYIKFEDPIANPLIPSQACLNGLHIALVGDVSGSIARYPEYVQQVKAALGSFVTAFFPGTPGIKMSISRFGTKGEVLQGMTNSKGSLDNAINNLFSLGEEQATNWKDGLEAGSSTFSGSSGEGVTKLLIFVTDGNPTLPDPGGVQRSRDTGSAIITDPSKPFNRAKYGMPIDRAVKAANAVKRTGVHILAVGVEGKNDPNDTNTKPTVENLTQISGPRVNANDVNTDVITGNFANLGNKLVNYTMASCRVAPPPAPTPGPGPGTGGTGPGTGNTGTGTGDKGTGTGNTGTGTGTKGDGTGETGTGTGTKGDGKGETGTGKGTTGEGDGETGEGDGTGETGDGVGTTAGGGEGETGTGSGETGGVTPEPTPAPAPAANVIEDEPEPAPVPEAQGTETIPPKVKPSIFFDGIEYTKGSLEDNVILASIPRTLSLWVYLAGGVMVLVGGAGGYYLWRSGKLREARMKVKRFKDKRQASRSKRKP